MLLTLVYMLGQIYNSYWSPSADTDQPDVDRDPEAQTCAICLESINLNAAPAGILVTLPCSNWHTFHTGIY